MSVTEEKTSINNTGGEINRPPIKKSRPMPSLSIQTYFEGVIPKPPQNTPMGGPSSPIPFAFNLSL